MKNIIFLPFFLAIISAEALAASTVSGFVTVEKDKTCRILWGSNADQISCSTGHLNSVKIGYVRLNFSDMNLQSPPICTFGASAGPDGKGGVELITPRLGNFSVNFVDILFVDQKGALPVGGAATFICFL